MSVKAARMLAPCSATVIISILDQFEEHARPEKLHELADAQKIAAFVAWHYASP